MSLENVEKKRKLRWLRVISASQLTPGALCFFALFKTIIRTITFFGKLCPFTLFQSFHLFLWLINNYCWSGVSTLVEKQRKKGGFLSGPWNNSPLSPSGLTHTGKNTRRSMKSGRGRNGRPLPPWRPLLLHRLQHGTSSSASPAALLRFQMYDPAAWAAVQNK